MKQQLFNVGVDQYKVVNKAGNLFSKIKEESRYVSNKKIGIQSMEYSYKQKIFGIETSRKILFDWKTLNADIENDNKSSKISLYSEIFDPISYQLKLKNDLINGSNLLKYSFIKRGKVRHYKFDRKPNTTLTIDKQFYKNVQPVVKVDMDNNETTTTVWLDADRGYEILKIEKIKNNKTTTLEMISTSCTNNKE